MPKAKKWRDHGEIAGALILLSLSEGRFSERKARLFACACCRRVWHLLSEKGRAAVETAERYVEGQAALEELAQALHAAGVAIDEIVNEHFDIRDSYLLPTVNADYAAYRACFLPQVAPEDSPDRYDIFNTVANAARCAALAVSPGRTRENFWLIDPVELSNQAILFHDVYGDPFRPVVLDSSWLTHNSGTVRKLAQVIYDEHRFEDLPVLADALEDAGCDSAEILEHCRGGGPHVRGCWVLDLLLGKE